MKANLSAIQKRYLIRALELKRHNLLFMGNAGTIRVLENLGLMEYVGDAVHEETGREGNGYTLTPKGEELARSL